MGSYPSIVTKLKLSRPWNGFSLVILKYRQFKACSCSLLLNTMIRCIQKVFFQNRDLANKIMRLHLIVTMQYFVRIMENVTYKGQKSHFCFYLAIEKYTSVVSIEFKGKHEIRSWSWSWKSIHSLLVLQKEHTQTKTPHTFLPGHLNKF